MCTSLYWWNINPYGLSILMDVLSYIILMDVLSYIYIYIYINEPVCIDFWMVCVFVFLSMQYSICVYLFIYGIMVHYGIIFMFLYVFIHLFIWMYFLMYMLVLEFVLICVYSLVYIGTCNVDMQHEVPPGKTVTTQKDRTWIFLTIF